MFNLKKILNDVNLVRDIKTIIAFLFAYAIAVISNGLIENFSPAALVSITVTLGALGTFFAIKIITNEFTDRGMFDEEESNVNLKQRLSKQMELSTQIKSTVAYDILTQYNKEKYEYLKKVKYNDLKQKYELDVKRYTTMIENAKLIRTLKWFNLINKHYISRLERRKIKITNKLAKLSQNDIYVKYQPIELNHLKLSNVASDEDNYNEAQRFSLTPQKKVRQRMATTNFIKTFFFVGFQGAAIAQITSWVEFIIFLVLMSLTLGATAITSYVNTRRYANMNYISILDEKIEKLQWLIKEQQTFDKPIEPVLS
jgi:hypothetical protein